MRNTILATGLGVLLLLCGSCKKDYSLSIAGTWEIRSAQNSMIPTISYPPGNDSLLKFTNTTYAVYSKGQMIKSGTYRVVEDHSFNALSVSSGQFTHRIIYDGNSGGYKIFLQVTGNELRFLAGDFSVDGGSDVRYERTEMGM